MFSAFRSVCLMLSLLAGCATETDLSDDPVDDAEGSAPELLQQVRAQGAGPFIRDGIPPPLRPVYTSLPPDPDARSVIQSGITTLHFGSCVSRMPGQRDISSSTALPVGNGRIIYCQLATGGNSSRAVVPVVSNVTPGPNGRFCVLGSAASYRFGGDNRLTMRLDRAPPGGTWTMWATAPYAMQVTPVNTNWGSAWPIWIEVYYQTVDWKYMPANGNCNS